ncbi:MAG TPA: prephenate dehydrogenase [Anaerolineae bacterium]|nr:prephenate dehydrogenase [Anaerolineae bacterium]HQK13621.1 prephenate dehydrogenase [Anaerolineae bacterium]
MKSLSDCIVSVVGLGLMGASLAGALRGKCARVVGVARRAEVIETALARGFVDEGTTDLSAGVHDANIVVLSTPVRVIIQQLAEIAPHLRPGCVVMDLGSTKKDIIDAMERLLPEHIQPLGAHPMCGKETSGIEVAEITLYRERTFILTPSPRTTPETLALGTALAEAVGAKPLVLDADRQDYIVGTVSHLPYLLACALVATADATTSKDPAAWKIVAGGFRDTSRVAGSDVTMMLDILMTNQTHVLEAVRVFEEQLRSLTAMIAAGDEDALRARLTHIRNTRKEMFP